jgi:cell division protein FtsA
VNAHGRNSWGGAGWQARKAVGLLDIGSAKTVCLIIAVPRPGASASSLADVRMLGAGVAPSRGISAGRVIALDAAEQALRAAVEEAERAAGVTLEDVVLAVACGELRSHHFAAHTKIAGRVVSRADIERMMAGARSYAERDGRALLHVACHAYRLDGAADIADPRGLAGQRLGANLSAVTADAAELSNLLHVVERAYLRPALVAPAPCVGALAATTAEERRRGVIAADLGAGGTALALFAEGRLVAIGHVPIGGDHITRDVAQKLSLPTHEAERIKRECGILAQAAGNAEEVVLLARASEDAPAPSAATKAIIRDVVRDRLLDLCGRIAEVVARSGVAAEAMALAVFSGGASQQAGLSELAAPVLGLAVRQARIEPRPGMPAGFESPAFATAVGLAEVARDPTAGIRIDRGGARAPGYLTRIGQWLQESF